MPSNFRYPIFKFQSNKYAREMFDNKTMLSRISDFRNQEKYKGRILDVGEGTADFFVNGLRIRKEINNKYIFCSTRHFLSDSLAWAISEKKECCVLIKDPDEFYKRITSTNNFKLNHLGSFDCHYYERREFDAESYAMLNKRNNDFLDICYFKPIEYQTQRETRGIWDLEHDNQRDQLPLEANIKDLLIWMEFPQKDKEKLLLESRIKVEVIMKNGEISSFSTEYPREVFTPIIYEDNKITYLGFEVPARMQNTRVEGAHIGLLFDDQRRIICCNPADAIAKIYFHI